MPKKPVQNRELTPEQQRSMRFLNGLILSWRLRDPATRVDLPYRDIVQMISQQYRDPRRSISLSGFSAWKNGENIPDVESTEAIIAAFDADPEEAYAAFNHEPPMTFCRLFKLVKEAVRTEQWEHSDETLARLEVTCNEHWDTPTFNDSIQIRFAREALNMSSVSLRDKAEYIASQVHYTELLRQLPKTGVGEEQE